MDGGLKSNVGVVAHVGTGPANPDIHEIQQQGVGCKGPAELESLTPPCTIGTRDIPPPSTTAGEADEQPRQSTMDAALAKMDFMPSLQAMFSSFTDNITQVHNRLDRMVADTPRDLQKTVADLGLQVGNLSEVVRDLHK